MHLGVETEIGYNQFDEVTSEYTTGNSSGVSIPDFENIFGNPPTGNESEPCDEALASPGTLMSVANRSATYVYDDGGNRVSQTIDGVETVLEYNSENRLVSETRNGYSVSHDYDDWGNEIERSTTTQGSTIVESFGYNALGRMSSYERASGGSPQAEWQYDFWPDGNRFAKSNLLNNTGQRYVTFGDNVARDYSLSSGSVTLQNTYGQGLGLDQKTLRMPVSGGRVHYLGDKIGTVNLTLTDTGTKSEECVRDVWGNSLAGDTDNERYGFAQREHDMESGLVYMRHRMYDPRIGRFTQCDPLLRNRAQEHYRYAQNNPVLGRDPLGLETTFAEAVEYFKFLYGKEGEALLRAFKKAKGVWEFGNVAGDVDVDYWGRKNLAIQIEKDVDPYQAAMLMRQGLEDALPYYGHELIGPGLADNMDALLRWNKARATEAGQLSGAVTELAMAGIAILNEPLDWVMTADELTSGNITAALGFLPFVSASSVKFVTKRGQELRFVSDFADKTTKTWSANFASEAEARTFARQAIGHNPVQVEANKWRSADGKWQYRAKPGDVSDRHVHLEEIDPKTGHVKQNVHLRWPKDTGR